MALVLTALTVKIIHKSSGPSDSGKFIFKSSTSQFLFLRNHFPIPIVTSQQRRSQSIRRQDPPLLQAVDCGHYANNMEVMKMIDSRKNYVSSPEKHELLLPLVLIKKKSLGSVNQDARASIRSGSS